MSITPKHLRRLLRRFHAVASWKYFLVFILLAFLSASCLRFEHLRMAKLRSAVLAADAAGNETELAEALNRLRDFTFSHLVLSLAEENGRSYLKLGTGPFYLEASYRRAAASALEAASQTELDDSNPHGNIYALASAVCRPRAIANGWSWDHPNHISCYMEELAKYPAEDVLNDTATAKLPSTELYRREYASPFFCFSLTTLVLILTLILALILIFRLLYFLILELALLFVK